MHPVYNIRTKCNLNFQIVNIQNSTQHGEGICTINNNLLALGYPKKRKKKNSKYNLIVAGKLLKQIIDCLPHAKELNQPSRLITDCQFLQRMNKNLREIGTEKVIRVGLKTPPLYSSYDSVLPNLFAIIGRTSSASTRDSRKGSSESNA